MYKPSLDSFLLIDSIKHYSGVSALEIGIGSGIISEFLTKQFKNVVATDIDFKSLLYCKTNTNSKITLICCDATTAISAKFDLIVSNPPYLPDDAFYDIAIHGGITGIEKTISFIETGITNLKIHGYIILIVSSLSDIVKLDNFISKKKLCKKIINKKELFCETLYVYELSHMNCK